MSYVVSMMTGLFSSIVGTAMLSALFIFSVAGPLAARAADLIQVGSVVSLEYSIFDEQRRLIESNKGKEPFRYVHGQGQIIKGLEPALLGMQVGDQKTVRLTPEAAFGPINPSAFRAVPGGSIPPDILRVGATLRAHTAHGQSHLVRVHEIKENTVILDFNHPLAGKTLIFEVKVLGNEPVQKR